MPNDKTVQIFGDVNAALTTFSSAMPVLMAAYAGFRAIWLATHTNATDTDYITYLQQQAQAGHQFNEAWLTANGYTKRADGSWAPAA